MVKGPKRRPPFVDPAEMLTSASEGTLEARAGGVEMSSLRTGHTTPSLAYFAISCSRELHFFSRY